VPKLLLADDSPTTQKVVQLTFADEGIDVIVADDGDAAIEMYDSYHPDIVLADINIPGLNGYEVCETIRTRATNGTTPVILLAGSFEPFDVEEAHRVGANDYLTKPFSSIRRLVATVTAMLDTVTRQDATVDETVQPDIAPPHTSEPDMTATNDIEQLYHESVTPDSNSASRAEEQLEISEPGAAVDHPADEPNFGRSGSQSTAFTDDLAHDDQLIETSFATAESGNTTNEVARTDVTGTSDTQGNISLESIPMPGAEPEPAQILQSQIPTVSFGSEQLGEYHDTGTQLHQLGEAAEAEAGRSEQANAETPAEELQIDQSGDETYFEPAPDTVPITAEQPPAEPSVVGEPEAAESFEMPGELINDQFQPESFAVPAIDQPAELEHIDEPAALRENPTPEIAAEPEDSGKPTPWDSVAGPAAPQPYNLEGSDLLELPLGSGTEAEHAVAAPVADERIRELTPEMIERIAKITASQISEEVVREIALRVVPLVIEEFLHGNRSDA
jgi:DNA-binding response OmpR family regulator